VNGFLTHLAVQQNVAASRQNQALAALHVRTTMSHTHVLNRGGRGVHSPLDRLRKPMSVENGGLRLSERSAPDCGRGLSNGVEVGGK